MNQITEAYMAAAGEIYDLLVSSEHVAPDLREQFTQALVAYPKEMNDLAEKWKTGIAALIVRHCPAMVWVEGPPKEEGHYWIQDRNATPRLWSPDKYLLTIIPTDHIIRHCRIPMPEEK